MKIEFPIHDEELESIEIFLERHTFPDLGKLKKFLDRLAKIDKSIDMSLKSDEIGVTTLLEGQKELVKKLTGKCHQLEIRKDVINLAEEAEKLANSSPERSNEDIASAAHHLRDRIDLFTSQHRLSRNNAKFIRFARACINKAEKHEQVIVLSETGRPKSTISLDNFRDKETSEASLEVSELLYELARVLYQEKFDEFKQALEGNFSVNQQKEIHFHVVTCKGNIQSVNDQVLRLKSIQGILGYAHVLADYYMGDTPYPSIVEIHNIFQDLDFVNQTESEESC